MKKFLLIVICLAAASLAGRSQQHLLFEGVAIDGDINPFVKTLIDKGFRQIKSDAALRGKVFGQAATVLAASNPDDGTVYLVMVTFDTKKLWENIRTCYESMKMQLSVRYGDPLVSREEFSSELAEADPLLALKYGNCTYLSHYTAPGGEISLSISRDAQVNLYFIDTENSRPMRPEL